MMTILLIEDDVPFCKLLEKFLIKNGYKVATAFSAADARDKIKTSIYNLIITDLRLPDADGILLLSEIKLQFPQIPVILMTGYSDVTTAVKAIKQGATDYISKPFNPEEVLLVIANALQEVSDISDSSNNTVVNKSSNTNE